MIIEHIMYLYVILLFYFTIFIFYYYIGANESKA